MFFVNDIESEGGAWATPILKKLQRILNPDRHIDICFKKDANGVCSNCGYEQRYHTNDNCPDYVEEHYGE